MSYSWIPKVCVKHIKFMDTITPLICHNCWSHKSYHDMTRRNIIYFKLISNVYQITQNEYDQLVNLPNEITIFPTEIVSLVFEYAGHNRKLNKLMDYLGQKFKYEQFEKSKFHFNFKHVKIQERKEKIYGEWFERQGILNEILVKYVMGFDAKLSFQMFNCSIYKSEFYYRKPKRKHVILTKLYIKYYHKKVKENKRKEEEKRKEEFINYINRNQIEITSSGNISDSDYDSDVSMSTMSEV